MLEAENSRGAGDAAALARRSSIRSRHKRFDQRGGPRETVIIVHGLWVNGRAMALLACHLRRAGFDTETFSYRSVRSSLSENAAQLKRLVDSFGDARVNLVGHSLGGLLLLEVLEQFPDLRVGRIVLAGAPYHDCYAARVLARSKMGDRMIGRSMHQWFDQEKRPWRGRAELGVIAGSRSIGLGRVFPGLPQPNDGTVAVEETRVPGAHDHLVMHVSHTEMLLSPRVAAQIAAFLRNGRFTRAYPAGGK